MTILIVAGSFAGGYVIAKLICIIARWMCIIASTVPIAVQNAGTWDELSDDEKLEEIREYVEERRKNDVLFRFLWCVGSLDQKKEGEEV